MTKLTEDMIIARTKSSDLSAVKKLNCWGSDLDDVSLVRRLSNVEVLSLSLNKIKTLADFQHCRNLVELYVRRNEIRDLSELCYLQDLPRLKRLLLAENPCVDSAGAAYRNTVLRCLPNLEVLDNVQVSQEEVDQAFKLGLILEQSTERTSPEPVYYREVSPPAPVSQAIRRNSSQYDYDDTPFNRSTNSVSHSPPADYYYQNQNARRVSHSPDYCRGSNEREITNGSGTGAYNQQRRPSTDYAELYDEPSQQHFQNHRNTMNTVNSPPSRVSSQQPIRNKPRTKSSNLLSAVLCLIPELDWQSLEVVELAVRRRMDELLTD